MGNIKKVMLVVDEDRKVVYSTLTAVCRGEGLNYDTVKKKWKGDVIIHEGLKIYKKDLLSL